MPTESSSNTLVKDQKVRKNRTNRSKGAKKKLPNLAAARKRRTNRRKSSKTLRKVFQQPVTPDGIFIETKEGKTKEFWCLLCKVDVKSKKNLVAHEKGKKHKIKLKKQLEKETKRENTKKPEVEVEGLPTVQDSPTEQLAEDASQDPGESSPDSDMYSRGYPPYNGNGWGQGFPPNPGDFPHPHPPYHFRQTQTRNHQWIPIAENYGNQNNRYPLYYSFEDKNYYSEYRNNQGYDHRGRHEDYSHESSNDGYNYRMEDNGVNDRRPGRRSNSRNNVVHGKKDPSNAFNKTQNCKEQKSHRNNQEYDSRGHHEDYRHESSKTLDPSFNCSKKANDNVRKEQTMGSNEEISQRQDSNGQSKKTNNFENKRDSGKSNITTNGKSSVNRDEFNHTNSQGCDTLNKTKKRDDRVKNSSVPECSSEVNSEKPQDINQETVHDEMKKNEQRRPSTEKVTDRIAQLINPSNPKDKAKVLKLVTQFSKSKRKDNLVKLNQQTAPVSNEKNFNAEKKQKKSDVSEPSLPVAAHSAENAWKKNETVQEVSNINPFGPGSPTKKRRRRKIQSGNETQSEPPVKRVRKRVAESNSYINLSQRVLLQEVAEEKLRNGSSSKHSCSSAECIESCINDVAQERNTTESTALTKVSRKKQKRSNFSVKEVYDPNIVINKVPSDLVDRTADSIPITKDSSNSNCQENILSVPVKREIDSEAPNMQFHPCLLEAFTLQEAMSEQQLAENSNQANTIPVESLIDLFASGNVKVKKEFNDPFIDVIRTVDPEILNQACEAQMSTVPPSGSENVPISNALPVETTTEDTSSEVSNGDDSCSYPVMKTSFKNILNEIQSISTFEERVKGDLQEAESKIQQFQALVDEWKTKKIKLQSEEETYRKQRNSLVRTMADLVAQCNFEKSEELSRPVTPKQTTAASLHVSVNAGSDQSNSGPTKASPVLSPQCISNSKSQKNSAKDSVEDTDEIAILPVPDKSSSIPVIDLDDCDSEESQPTAGTEKSPVSNILSGLLDTRSIPSHSATVNSLQVFEGYLYSCSNDSTARRFSLNKNSDVVVYNHQNRNVSQLCVEKVKETTFVFTICTGSKTVSAFIAKDGTLYRTYSLNYAVVSLCKSKGLIYAGLRNGSIVVCNGKDHKELVNIAEPIRSIDTTYQGRLNILVTLSIHGNVSIRDADRNGLLIRYVKARGYLPLFMTVCSDSVFLSSAGVMTVLNIESGTYSSKYSFAAAYTCLTVHRDSIFTASFSGLVRCYSKEEEKPVKMYYGAGNTSITCIYVYDGWVFTGNKFGSVSVFKHDPHSVHPCKLGKCDFLFPRLEDLRTHVLLKKDHVFPSPGCQCSWPKCQFIYPLMWDSEAIKLHLTSHLCSQA